MVRSSDIEQNGRGFSLCLYRICLVLVILRSREPRETLKSTKTDLVERKAATLVIEGKR